MPTTESPKALAIRVICKEKDTQPIPFDQVIADDLQTETFHCQNCGRLIAIQKDRRNLSGIQRALLSLVVIPFIMLSCIFLYSTCNIFVYHELQEAVLICIGLGIGLAVLGFLIVHFQIFRQITTGIGRMRVKILQDYSTDSKVIHTLKSPSAKRGPIKSSLKPDETILLEVKQHKGIIVLAMLAIPFQLILLGLLGNQLRDAARSSGGPSACLTLILGIIVYSDGIALLFQFAFILLSLFRRPTLIMTNKRLLTDARYLTAQDGQLSEITEVSVQRLVEMRDVFFGNLSVKMIQNGKKRTLLFPGLPEPKKLIDALSNLNLPAQIIKIKDERPRVIVGFSIGYGLLLCYVGFVALILVWAFSSGG